VFVPSRELAHQIAVEAGKLKSRLAPGQEMRGALLVGGEPLQREAQTLSAGADLVVATPGRLMAHLAPPASSRGQRTARGRADDRKGRRQRGGGEGVPLLQQLAALRVLVLDEADQLLLKFRADMERILRVLPITRQTLLFTATVPPEVREVAGIALRPDHVFLDLAAQGGPSHAHIDQRVLVVDAEDVVPALGHVLGFKVRERPRDHKIIVFLSCTALVRLLADVFRVAGLQCVELHSSLSQDKREAAQNRLAAPGPIVAFATDLISRGLDFPGVTLVVQVGAVNAQTYEHRVGRTGRAGRPGEGLLILGREEAGDMSRELRELPLRAAEARSGVAGGLVSGTRIGGPQPWLAQAASGVRGQPAAATALRSLSGAYRQAVVGGLLRWTQDAPAGFARRLLAWAYLPGAA
jgi:ATP-dependent RNA helicase MSS116, mitochondrial